MTTLKEMKERHQAVEHERTLHAFALDFEALRGLGQAAVHILNSCHLKQHDPQLYFALKDAAIVVRDCRKVEEVNP